MRRILPFESDRYGGSKCRITYGDAFYVGSLEQVGPDHEGFTATIAGNVDCVTGDADFSGAGWEVVP